MFLFFFFNVTATTEIYPYCPTLSLHDALPLSRPVRCPGRTPSIWRADPSATAPAPSPPRSAPVRRAGRSAPRHCPSSLWRSEEHTSELQSLMRISYAVFCLKKKIQQRKKQ